MMRTCEHCKKDMIKGHVMFDNEFYLCEDCFNKFYSESIALDMYENDLQYYTEWEDLDDSNV